MRAQQPEQLVLSSNQPVVVDGNEAIYRDHVEARQGDLLITADELRYRRDEAAADLKLTGHVIYTKGGIRILADRIVVHRSNGSFEADRVRLGSYPYFIEGRSASGTRNEITVLDARIDYGEPGPFQPAIGATKVVISPGHSVRFEGAQVGIGRIRPLPFPQFDHNLSDPLLGFVTLTGGYRSSLGAFVDAGLHLPVAPGVRLGGDVGYYTSRGVLVGPSGTYANPTDPDKLRGVFRSGYINDHGDKKTDVLGRPVPENRAFVEWQHQQNVTDNFSLTAQFKWWRDSEVMRDFRPRLFFPVQQPDTFVEATYAGDNMFVSAFGRFAPNDFEIVQQRTPEIRVDVLPTNIGGGFIERFNGSIAMLKEKPILDINTWFDRFFSALLAGTITSFADGFPSELRSTRMDAYYALTRPIAQGDWLTFTPVVGGRVTHYMNTQIGDFSLGQTTRLLGEVGADAEMHLSGTFAYKNEAWGIDGLRHLFTPKIGYRYIPQEGHTKYSIPNIDRQTFSTYLQPLGLGDARNVDDLQASNILRLGFDNTLQTRDPKYGSRDLLTFNVANDFRFKRQPGERTASEIHTEIAAMPTRWLTVGVYNSFAPQDFRLREFNTGITVHDGDRWSVLFGNNFLRDQLQDYNIDARRRLNEEFEALARLRYDERKHRFNEQAYGLVQNLANTWRISYLVSLYSGPRRESHFGFSIQIDTVRF